MFFRQWFDSAGIVSIRHLLDHENDFFNLHKFSSKFQLNAPFTQYYGLLSAIPQNWKTMLGNRGQEQNKQTIPVDTSTSSSIYSTLLKDVFVRPTAERKILRHGFTKKNIQKVYLFSAVYHHQRSQNYNVPI